jgi:hypothetical protein
MKTCSRCKQSKRKSEFHLRSTARDGHMSHCKSCNALKARRWRKKNPERRRELDKRYDLKRWSAFLKRKYGMTIDQYNAMLLGQRGLCAICGDARPGGRTNRMHVDHCHSTKIVRGLLCSRCNQMLGYAKDDPSRLIRAAFYLNAEVAKAFIESYIEAVDRDGVGEQPKMKHIVAISGGKDSTALALHLAEIEPRDYTYLITPTGDELPEMVEHWEKLEQLLGKPVRTYHQP